jgi:hypothetical protein
MFARTHTHILRYIYLFTAGPTKNKAREPYKWMKIWMSILDAVTKDRRDRKRKALVR